MDVNLAPLMNYGVEILGMVLMALGSWAASWLAHKFKLDSLEPELDRIITEGVRFARRQVKGLVGNQVGVHVDNEIAGKALQYVADNGPKTAKKLGYTPEQLRARIEAYLDVANEADNAGGGTD